MESIEELKELYGWTKRDSANLEKIYESIQEDLERIIKAGYESLQRHQEARDVLSDEKIKESLFKILRDMVIKLLKVEYDDEYLNLLSSAGVLSAKMGLEPHYLRTFMSAVREAILKALFPKLKESPDVLFSLNKAIDMAGGMLDITYRMEELRAFMPSGRIQRLLLRNVRKVSWFFDYFIISVLAVVGVFIIFWIVYEVYLISVGSLPLERGGLSVLGSILILYAVSELITEEVRHIKGSILSLKVFISVALAAIIRKVLIVSLSPEKITELMTLSVVLVALTLSFWIIHKIEGAAQTKGRG